jgi:opacity protein-like surface antigen
VNGSIESEGPGSSNSASGSGLGISAGLGYNFSRNLGAEAQYVTASGLDFDGYKMDFNWMQVSFKYRF